MIGSRIQISKFDASTKKGWLDADVNGFLYTWMATIIAVFIAGLIVAATTGLDISTLGSPIASNLRRLIGNDATLLVMLLLSALPAFVIVFVLRRNFTVLGPRRQFGYIWRWL